MKRLAALAGKMETENLSPKVASSYGTGHRYAACDAWNRVGSLGAPGTLCVLPLLRITSAGGIKLRQQRWTRAGW
jgi:hypothetical protein